MGMRGVLFGVAGGIAIGIGVAWALADPKVTGFVFGIAGFVMALLAIAELWVFLRRRAAREAFDVASQTGIALRLRLREEPITLPPDEDDRARRKEVDLWEHETQNLIHKYADDWHQRFYTWPVPMGAYLDLKLWRSNLVTYMDSRLEALAEIRTKL